MATLLLDTNIIIDVLNGRNRRLEQVEALVSRGGLLACTSVTVTEIYMGIRPKEISPTDAFLRELDFYAVDREAAQLAGQLYNRWRQKGHTLALPDVTIAAVCIANGLTLVTDHRKHFPMQELKVHTLGATL